MSEKRPLKPEEHKSNPEIKKPKPYLEHGEKRNQTKLNRYNPQFQPKGGRK